MAGLRLFGPAADAAGTRSDTVPGATVADVVAEAVRRYGDGFARVAAICRVWVNGDQASPDTPVGDGDEVALLPPVSGG